MLDTKFAEVYSKFKLHFYQKVFSRFQEREASLTTVETFCMEIIQALGTPTVNEFASFVQISPPNAAYKVNNLIQKGYLKKVRSETDRREYHLVITPKYQDYYSISYSYLSTVMQRIRERFSDEDAKKLEEMLTIISEELMPEIPIRLAPPPRVRAQDRFPDETKEGRKTPFSDRKIPVLGVGRKRDFLSYHEKFLRSLLLFRRYSLPHLYTACQQEARGQCGKRCYRYQPKTAYNGI